MLGDNRTSLSFSSHGTSIRSLSPVFVPFIHEREAETPLEDEILREAKILPSEPLSRYTVPSSVAATITLPSLFEVLLPDMNGNIATNAALHLAKETNNTLIFGNNDRLIVTIGVDDMVIIDTGDALLVCKTDQSQKVKEVVEHLKKHRQEKFL